MQPVSIVEQLLRHPQIREYRLLSPKQLSFSPAVAEACASNACGKYGSCWTCPPGVGDLRLWQQRILQYENLAVFTCVHSLEDCFDFEGMIRGQEKTMVLLHQLRDELSEHKMDILPLGCAGCNICQPCTYPQAPCRFPQRAIVSIEACGIDVVQLSRDTGIRYHNGENTVTYFCIILF